MKFLCLKWVKVMNKKLKYLTKMSLLRRLKSKWFLIINILLVIIILGIVNVDLIVNFFGGDFNQKNKIIVLDNTNRVYDLFEDDINNSNNKLELTSINKIEIELTNKSEEEIKQSIKNNKTIFVIFNNNKDNIISSKIITNSYIDAILYQKIISAINNSKNTLAILEYNIDIKDLNKLNIPVIIDRQYLDESKTESEENMDIIMGFVFPIIILPFFMLIIFLVQTLGAEINEEKTTKGMEIIISNVSAKIHFLSKIIAGNLFVFIQGFILIMASIIGLIIRFSISNTSNYLVSIGIDINSIWNQLVESGFINKLIYIIPVTLILILLSFLAYSLLAGILASMTTSMEDYQQLQTPIILISIIGYYLSILAPTFQGSIFIKVISYLPFISALLCPSLLVIGQALIIDIFISILMLLIVIYLLIKYGLRIYKVGILNYSTSKLWNKMFKAIKK